MLTSHETLMNFSNYAQTPEHADLIRTLLLHSTLFNPPKPYYDAQIATFDLELRDALEMLDEPISLDDAKTIRNALESLDRESLTEIALHHSLCPLHLIDYAICFDDENAECAQIRLIHPSHDT